MLAHDGEQGVNSAKAAAPDIILLDINLPIMDGWNYAVRMYEPEQAIQDGTWTFPRPPVARSK